MASKRKGSKFAAVCADFKQLGFEFRINDLDDSLEFNSVSMGGCWQRMTDIHAAVIRSKMHDIGYGQSGSGKGGYGAMNDAQLRLANQNRFNPIRSYFGTIADRYEATPNGVQLIHKLAKYFTNPDGMFGTWLFKWMVGTIAKIFQGQRNPMLVLVGPQRTGKSYFAEWLCPLKEHFYRDSINPDDKDSHIRLTDMMVWEVEELGATTRRSDVESLKGFITRDFVRKRPAYGRHRIDKPALSSFIGTVNHDGAGFLNDPTGTTRFLACEVEAINRDYSTLFNPDDLWSEAYWFYRNVPKSWELSKSEEARQAEINSQYEVPSALAEVFDDLFEVTHEESDFIPTREIKSTLDLHYKITNEQLFYRELARVLKGLGCEQGRASYEQGKHHPRGWKGVKKRV